MIKKWRNRFIIYVFIAAFLTIIGIYFYINMKSNNDVILRLKKETFIEVEMKRLNGTIYSGEGKFYWGYDLPDYVRHDHPESGFDAATMTMYSLSQFEEMNGLVKIYFIVNDDGSFITYDKDYVDRYIPFDYFESFFLWTLAGIAMGIALYYLARNIVFMVIAAKGVECIGRFEEAYHTKFGSAKYFKVKYTYTFNGQVFTDSSPAVYTGMDADKLKSYGTLIIKLLGKKTVIDHKL